MKYWHLSGSAHLCLALSLWGCLSAGAIQPGWAENKENFAQNADKKVDYLKKG